MTTPNQMQEWKVKMLSERAERRTTQTPSENKVEDLIDEAMQTYARAEASTPVDVEVYNEERHTCLTLLIDAVGLAVSCYRTTLDGLARNGQEFSIRLPTTHDNVRMGNGMRLVEEAVQALWAASSRFEGEGDGCGREPKCPAHYPTAGAMADWLFKNWVDPNPTACCHVAHVVEELPVPREATADKDDHRR